MCEKQNTFWQVAAQPLLISHAFLLLFRWSKVDLNAARGTICLLFLPIWYLWGLHTESSQHTIFKHSEAKASCTPQLVRVTSHANPLFLKNWSTIDCLLYKWLSVVHIWVRINTTSLVYIHVLLYILSIFSGTILHPSSKIYSSVVMR